MVVEPVNAERRSEQKSPQIRYVFELSDGEGEALMAVFDRLIENDLGTLEPYGPLLQMHEAMGILGTMRSAVRIDPV